VATKTGCSRKALYSDMKYSLNALALFCQASFDPHQ